MSIFQYEPLATPTTIRLVNVPATNAADCNEEIQLEIEQFELSDVSKDYYAMSYVRGKP